MPISSADSPVKELWFAWSEKASIKSIKNNHTFRCGYFYAYREDFTYPAEVNSACAKEDSAPPCPRHLARPIGDGAPGEKEENAARLGGIFEA